MAALRAREGRRRWRKVEPRQILSSRATGRAAAARARRPRRSAGHGDQPAAGGQAGAGCAPGTRVGAGAPSAPRGAGAAGRVAREADAARRAGAWRTFSRTIPCDGARAGRGTKPKAWVGGLASGIWGSEHPRDLGHLGLAGKGKSCKHPMVQRDSLCKGQWCMRPDSRTILTSNFPSPLELPRPRPRRSAPPSPLFAPDSRPRMRGEAPSPIGPRASKLSKYWLRQSWIPSRTQLHL